MAQKNGIKLPSHSMPSDYSDVQPKSYDPEFISQISSQMQVPDRIAMSNGEHNDMMPPPTETVNNRGIPYNGMMVPDRILVAVDSSMDILRRSPTIRLKSPDFHLGKHDDSDSSCEETPFNFKRDNQHIGVKSDLALQLRSSDVNPEAMSYVGLLTPPRTLTMEESFPMVEEPPKEEPELCPPVAVNSPNGHVLQPSPYDPGVTLNDSLLLSEEDEVTMLRRQMAKLVRRVHVIEEEQRKRSQREFIIYPMFFGYFLWKFLGWLVRDSRS